MRAYEFYDKIEAVLQGSSLSVLPIFKNTYQSRIVTDEVREALKDSGIAICYYFHKASIPKVTQGSMTMNGEFTFAVIENITQHRGWIAANSNDTGFKSKSSLEVAEELAFILSQSRDLIHCGGNIKSLFPEEVIQRVEADGGFVQFDVNMNLPIRL